MDENFYRKTMLAVLEDIELSLRGLIHSVKEDVDDKNCQAHEINDAILRLYNDFYEIRALSKSVMNLNFDSMVGCTRRVWGGKDVGWVEKKE